jgi:hypothetical protein
LTTRGAETGRAEKGGNAEKRENYLLVHISVLRAGKQFYALANSSDPVLPPGFASQIVKGEAGDPTWSFRTAP